MNRVLSLEETKSIFGEEIKSALDFVQDNFSVLSEGKFEIPSTNIWGVKIKYLTKKVGNMVTYEKHKNIIDLHFVVSGTEDVYYFDVSEGEVIVKKEYDPIDDYELVEHAQKNASTLSQNCCIAFDRNCYHATGFNCDSDYVEKAVLKIPFPI